MSVSALAELLARRLDEAGRSGDAVVSVAELHRTLLPYHVCRGSLGYATKAEYDLELLELLADESCLVPAEREFRAAVRDERSSPEPGLGFLKNFAAAQLRIQPGLSQRGPDSRSAEGVPPRSAPAADSLEAIDAAPAVAVAREVRSPAGSCWRCGRELPGRPDLRYCVFCGSDQQRPACLACDEELEGGWAFCPRCGTERSASEDLTT